MKKLVILAVMVVGSIFNTVQASEVCFIKTWKMSARANLHLTCSGREVRKIVDSVNPKSVDLTKKKAEVIRDLIRRGFRVESENMFIKY